MTDKYTPQVGDRVRLPAWPHHEAYEVTAVGRTVVLLACGDREVDYRLDAPWIKVDPLPELWCNVYDVAHPEAGYIYRQDRPPSLAVHAFRVYLIPDGDGYRAEVIRP
jgi:hypothetical protein